MDMSKGNSCGKCIETLLAQNKELWAEAVQKIGDSENADWCNVCDQLFVQNVDLSQFCDEIEITSIDS